MSEDAYADEFSDSEHQSGRKDDHDEQHTQKMHGKIELLETNNSKLQSKIDELQRELIAERASHQLKKSKLTSSQQDLEIAHKNISESSEISNFSDEIATEFMDFCKRHPLGFDVDAMEVSKTISEADIIEGWRSASNLINAAKVPPAAITGSDNELVTRIRNLEYELRLALGAAEDIKALKSKVLNMVERFRSEKDARNRAEVDVVLLRKKIEILGDHLEKLMLNLKYEATAKMRTVEALRTSERYVQKLKEKCDTVTKKCNAKDRLIFELREGSKILEDQLRLMDEKYLELRGKLDWARDNGMKRLKQAERAASELRMKYIMSGGTGSLDSIVLPDIGGASFGMDSDQYSMGDSRASSRLQTSNRSLLSTSSRKSNSRMSRSVGSLESTGSSQEPTLENVQEKLRKRQGLQVEWTEDKIRNLTKKG